jgi:hypothetical protein
VVWSKGGRQIVDDQWRCRKDLHALPDECAPLAKYLSDRARRGIASRALMGFSVNIKRAILVTMLYSPILNTNSNVRYPRTR